MFNLLDRAETGVNLSPDEALRLFNVPFEDVLGLFDAANRIRMKHFGNRVDLCSLVNAKSGNCSEDCAFCSQSVHHRANIRKYGLLPKEKILGRAVEMERAGAHRFCIVVSGGAVVRETERRGILEALEAIRTKTGLLTCASLGFLDSRWARRLLNAGLVRYHHNLEAAPGFYPSICSTHPLERRIETAELAVDAGLELCSGGIWGMGETPRQRIELAFELKRLKVSSIPINLLNPIPGTRLERQPPEPPLNHLKMVAVYRFLFPAAEIRFAGGREINLRQLQPLGMLAGANGLMIGHYLTTSGRSVEADMEMISDLRLTAAAPDDAAFEKAAFGDFKRRFS
ncbi:MAG: biotin synthase BioB [bacterium]